MYTALRATSLTLASHLTSQLIADPELAPWFDSGLGGTMVVSLNTPAEMTEAGTQGISLWLYRVIRDDQRLNSPPERVTPTRIRPAPLPMRLHYLITPIVPLDTASPSASSERELAILGKVLQLFHEHPVFRGPDLRDSLTGSNAEIAMRLEVYSMDEIARIWMALQRSYELSVCYEAAVVNIEPDVQPVHVSPVHTAIPRYATIIEREETET